MDDQLSVRQALEATADIFEKAPSHQNSIYVELSLNFWLNFVVNLNRK